MGELVRDGGKVARERFACGRSADFPATFCPKLYVNFVPGFGGELHVFVRMYLSLQGTSFQPLSTEMGL